MRYLLHGPSIQKRSRGGGWARAFPHKETLDWLIRDYGFTHDSSVVVKRLPKPKKFQIFFAEGYSWDQDGGQYETVIFLGEFDLEDSFIRFLGKFAYPIFDWRKCRAIRPLAGGYISLIPDFALSYKELLAGFRVWNQDPEYFEKLVDGTDDINDILALAAIAEA